MLQMKKKPLEDHQFNRERFDALWRVNKQDALDYQEQCSNNWKDYVKLNNPNFYQEDVVEQKVIIDSKNDVEETPPLKTEEEYKLEMVSILKANGMKLASTKWSVDTLEKKVASLNQ